MPGHRELPSLAAFSVAAAWAERSAGMHEVVCGETIVAIGRINTLVPGKQNEGLVCI